MAKNPYKKTENQKMRDAYNNIIDTLEKKLKKINKKKDKVTEKMMDTDMGDRQSSRYAKRRKKSVKLANLDIYYEKEIERYKNLISKSYKND